VKFTCALGYLDQGAGRDMGAGNRMASMDEIDAMVPGIASKIAEMQALPESAAAEKLSACLAALGGDAELKETGFLLAGAVKCLKARSLVSYGVLDKLEACLNDKKQNRAREGAGVAVECLAMVLSATFEPYVIKLLASIVQRIGDKVKEVQRAADTAFETVMSNLSQHGIYAVLPVLGQCIRDRDTPWQSKARALDAIKYVTGTCKLQVSRCSAQIVPSVIESLADTKSEVQQAAKECLTAMGKQLIKSPEMVAMVEPMVAAIIDPQEHNTPCVEKLMDVTFMNPIDRPCLSIMIPVLKKAMQEKRVEHKRRALLVIGNVCGLVIDSKELIAYAEHVLPELDLCVRDSNPEMRGYGASAMTAFLRGMAPDHLQEKLSTLNEDIVKLQQQMVDSDEKVKGKAEQQLKDLIAQCSGEATKQHHTEEEIAADLERLRLESEKKQQQELEEFKAKEELRQKAEQVDVTEMSDVAKRELAAAEHAIKMAEQKKLQDIEDKKEAARLAEEEKMKAMKKFKEEQAKAMLKHKQAKKKK
jgi:hypothetical protein